MHHFAAIASRYGVNPEDVQAVDDFFAETLQAMPTAEQEAIVEELLEKEAERSPEPAEMDRTCRVAEFDDWIEKAAGGATSGLTTDQILRETRDEE
jgi:hypothetical protein